MSFLFQNLPKLPLPDHSQNPLFPFHNFQGFADRRRQKEEGQMGRRILNEALRKMVNAERRGKATVELQPISTVLSSFLKIMKDRGIPVYYCHIFLHVPGICCLGIQDAFGFSIALLVMKMVILCWLFMVKVVGDRLL